MFPWKLSFGKINEEKLLKNNAVKLAVSETIGGEQKYLWFCCQISLQIFYNSFPLNYV